LGLVAVFWLRQFKPVLQARLPQVPNNIGLDGRRFARYRPNAFAPKPFSTDWSCNDCGFIMTSKFPNGSSPKISSGRRRIRFSRCRAASKAAREKIGLSRQNQIVGLFPRVRENKIGTGQMSFAIGSAHAEATFITVEADDEGSKGATKSSLYSSSKALESNGDLCYRCWRAPRLSARLRAQTGRADTRSRHSAPDGFGNDLRKKALARSQKRTGIIQTLLMKIRTYFSDSHHPHRDWLCSTLIFYLA
jgi:hypothetical protein